MFESAGGTENYLVATRNAMGPDDGFLLSAPLTGFVYAALPANASPGNHFSAIHVDGDNATLQASAGAGAGTIMSQTNNAVFHSLGNNNLAGTSGTVTLVPGL